SHQHVASGPTLRSLPGLLGSAGLTGCDRVTSEVGTWGRFRFFSASLAGTKQAGWSWFHGDGRRQGTGIRNRPVDGIGRNRCRLPTSCSCLGIGRNPVARSNLGPGPRMGPPRTATERPVIERGRDRGTLG